MLIVTLILLLLTVCRHCLFSDQTTSSRPFATQLVCSIGAHCHTNGHFTYCTSPHRHKKLAVVTDGASNCMPLTQPLDLVRTTAKSISSLTCIMVTECYAVQVCVYVHAPVRAKPTRGVFTPRAADSLTGGVFGRLSTVMLRSGQSHPTGRTISSCFDFNCSHPEQQAAVVVNRPVTSAWSADRLVHRSYRH